MLPEACRLQVEQRHRRERVRHDRADDELLDRPEARGQRNSRDGDHRCSRPRHPAVEPHGERDEERRNERDHRALVDPALVARDVDACLEDEENAVRHQNSDQGGDLGALASPDARNGQRDRGHERDPHHEQEDVAGLVDDPVQRLGEVVAPAERASVGPEGRRAARRGDRRREDKADRDDDRRREKPSQQAGVTDEPRHRADGEDDRRHQDDRLEADRDRGRGQDEHQRLVPARRIEQRPPQAPQKQRDHGQERHFGHHEPRIDERRERGGHRRGGERPAAARHRARPEIDDHDRDGHQQRLERLQHHQSRARAEGRQRGARQQRVNPVEARLAVEELEVSSRPERPPEDRVDHLVGRDPRRVEPERRPETRDDGDDDEHNERDAPPAPSSPFRRDPDLGKLTSSGCAAGRAQRFPRLHGEGH